MAMEAQQASPRDVELSNREGGVLLSTQGSQDSAGDGDFAAPPARRSQKWVIAATILGLCVVTAAVGATVFFTSRTSSAITVPEKFQAQFSVKDIHSIHPFSYTGRMSKHNDADGNWQLEIKIENIDPATGHRHVMSIIDRRAYFEEFADEAATTPLHTSCYPKDRVPPINDIDDVLQAAVAVPEGAVVAEAVTGACHDADGEKFALVWGGDLGGQKANQYYYCQTSGGAHQLIGKEFVATVFDVDATPSETSLGLTVPTNLTSGQPLDCPVLPDDISALGDWQSTRRRLGAPAIPAKKRSKARRTPGANVECWFVHGSGPSSDLASSTSFSDYWGNVENWVGDDCDSVHFLRRDYTSKSWDDYLVTQDFCSAVASSGTSVADRIIFSHGFGSLVVGHAFSSLACTLESSSDWYAISTPWAGSAAADDASTLCSTYASSLDDIAPSIGMCSGTSPSTAMLSLDPDYSPVSTTFGTVASFAASNLEGSMCGSFSLGMMTGAGDQLPVVDSLITFGGMNDGFMSLANCKNGQSFQAGASHDFYASGNNFLDTTCRYGNAWFDVFLLASPCSWYSHVSS